MLDQEEENRTKNQGYLIRSPEKQKESRNLVDLRALSTGNREERLIMSLNRPTNRKELHNFLGKVGTFNKRVPLLVEK